MFLRVCVTDTRLHKHYAFQHSGNAGLTILSHAKIPRRAITCFSDERNLIVRNDLQANCYRHELHILRHLCECKHGVTPGAVVTIGSTVVWILLPLEPARLPEARSRAKDILTSFKPLAIDHHTLLGDIPGQPLRIDSNSNAHDFASDVGGCLVITDVHTELVHEAVVVRFACVVGVPCADRQGPRQLRRIGSNQCHWYAYFQGLGGLMHTLRSKDHVAAHN